MDNPVKTISVEEYNDLKQKELKLECLENCGVDNWVGYSDALEQMQLIINNKVE